MKHYARAFRILFLGLLTFITRVEARNSAANPFRVTSCGVALLESAANAYVDRQSGGHGNVVRNGNQAVKRANDPITQKYLTREGLILRRMQEQGAPPIFPHFYEMNQTAAGAELRTEWIEGESFLAHIVNDDVTVKNFKSKAQVFTNQLKQLLGGLEWMHQRNFLHLDLKPSNLMVRPDGTLMIIDFGAAVKTDASPFLGQPLSYTEGFAAPELLSKFKGQPDFDRPISPATEMYAVGKTIKVWIENQRENILGISPAIETYLNRMQSEVVDPLTRREPSERLTLEQARVALAKLATPTP